jgi:calcineurin-like phosphoesterase family protein
MIWFTADTHFGHTGIIQHCRRPFANAREMDEALIGNINERVGVRDTLYHLGDFSLGGAGPAVYRRRIRCRNIILILGNHDPQNAAGYPRPSFAALFRDVHLLYRLKASIRRTTQRIVLCHYAMRVWDQSHRGAWHLFGHSHGALREDAGALALDVGVDAAGFVPLSLEDVTMRMEEKASIALSRSDVV